MFLLLYAAKIMRRPRCENGLPAAQIIYQLKIVAFLAVLKYFCVQVRFNPIWRVLTIGKKYDFYVALGTYE